MGLVFIERQRMDYETLACRVYPTELGEASGSGTLFYSYDGRAERTRAGAGFPPNFVLGRFMALDAANPESLRAFQSEFGPIASPAYAVEWGAAEGGYKVVPRYRRDDRAVRGNRPFVNSERRACMKTVEVNDELRRDTGSIAMVVSFAEASTAALNLQAMVRSTVAVEGHAHEGAWSLPVLFNEPNAHTLTALATGIGDSVSPLYALEDAAGIGRPARSVNLTEFIIVSYMHHLASDVVATCEECGAPFFKSPTNKRKRFCSPSCQNVWSTRQARKAKRKGGNDGKTR